MEIQQPPSRRPVVLVFAPHYWPAFRAGGAVRTLRNMAAQLGNAIDFRFFTRDRDVGDTAAYAGVEPGRWGDVDGARVMYAGDRLLDLGALSTMIRDVDPDVVYLNSFFDPSFSLRPLMTRRLGMMGRDVPWVIAPRGEFSKGAIALKPWKKMPYMAFCRLFSLHNGVIWQASSDLEREDIRRVMGAGSRIRVAPDLTERLSDTPPPATPRPEGPLRVCLLSRISPMKNVRFAIEVVLRLRRPVEFSIHGPIEDRAYWETCQPLIAAAPAGCRIEWKGEVPPERVRETIAASDVFLLPTLGENFGHVIFESLAAGVPVLVSDRTPWRDLDTRGSGWVRPLEAPQEFVEVLEAAAERDAGTRRSMAVAAHAHALEVSRSEAILGANRGLFFPPGNGPTDRVGEGVGQPR
jgi:glycosyltransferase involved in cell wall biosynthesis